MGWNWCVLLTCQKLCGFEVTSVMVPHGPVSPIDDKGRLVLLKVWMPLLGDEVSGTSVTLDADLLEAAFADLRLVIIGMKPVVPTGAWLVAADIVMGVSGASADVVCVVWDVITRPVGVEIETIPGVDVLKVESISEGLEGMEVARSEIVIEIITLLVDDVVDTVG